MSSIRQRIRDSIAAGFRQRITRAGYVFSTAAVIIGFAAFASANNLLFLILAAMLATLVVSGFVGRLSLAGLELEFLHPEHISARRNVSGRIIVQNDKAVIPSFSIRLYGSPESGLPTALYFPSIPAAARLEAPVDLYFPRRGPYRNNTFNFSTRFPFGFTERHIPVQVRHEITVYPSVDPHPALEPLLTSITGSIDSHFRGRGSDFYRIRPYEQFESARHVDWKATAHTGDLQVREFAREQEQSISILLDLTLPAGDVFENAVECCAYLAWHLTRGSVARFRLITQQVSLRVPEECDVYTILKYLALVAPASGQAPSPPDEQDSIHVLFSAQSDLFGSLGWHTDFVVGLDRLAVARPDCHAAAGTRQPAE